MQSQSNMSYYLSRPEIYLAPPISIPTKIMTIGTVETSSRLVVWRINSLDKICCDLKSEEFMIGKWYWYLEYSKDLKKILLYLSVNPKHTQTIQCPIASIVFHVFSPKGSPIIDTGDELRDMELVSGSGTRCCHVVNTSSVHEVTFGLEFRDLKLRDDDRTYSIWSEECLEQNSLNESISRMLSESICTDIVINARDGSIEAHRAVLATNSPVFRAMFSKYFIENKTSTVNINDMSIEACKVMLNFLYGKRGSIELRAHNMELIIAADKYDIINLKRACENSLCEDVGVTNVFERLMCAHRYDLLELKNTCLFYLVKMGMIFKLRDEYKLFLQEADREIIVQVSDACLDAWQAT